MAGYQVQNQWGGNQAPWHQGGAFVLGYRDNQAVVAIDIKSGDGGKTLSGTMTYAGEGPIGFRGTAKGANIYEVQNQWGGDSAPWHEGGMWVIGARSGQAVVALDVKSSDDGQTMTGTMTYAGEGPIGFKAESVAGYNVENQWGGDNAPWHVSGPFVLSSRHGQDPIAFDITSNDGGKSFTGTMQYEGEGPIGFRAQHQSDNAYNVENQWGGDKAPWHQAGTFLIGGRSDQRAVALNVKSSDSGQTLSGTMTYADEGPIGFRGQKQASGVLEAG